MPVTICFCGGRLRRQDCPRVCMRDDCPRDKLGYGSWHKALPKLQKLGAGELKCRYPKLNLRDLEAHVKQAGRRHFERVAARAATTLPLRCRSHTPFKRAYERCHLQEADHSKRPRREAIPATGDRQKEKGAWRNPRQSEILPQAAPARALEVPQPALS